MHRWMASAAGGTSHRLNPGGAKVFSLSKMLCIIELDYKKNPGIKLVPGNHLDETLQNYFTTTGITIPMFTGVDASCNLSHNL